METVIVKTLNCKTVHIINLESLDVIRKHGSKQWLKDHGFEDTDELIIVTDRTINYIVETLNPCTIVVSNYIV